MDHPERASSLATALMRRLGLWLLRLAGVSAAATAVPMTALGLPAASTFVQCFADGNNSFHATECNQGGFPGVPPSAFASATLSPVPAASVEVTAPPATVLGAGADSNVFYYFGVTGGSPGDVVPILIDFALQASSTPESSALARLIVRTSALALPAVEELVCNPQACDETTFSDTLSLEAVSGSTLDSVTLYAMVQAPATRFSDESARAFVDPYIYIDPAFPDASLYSIVVSEGVGNAPVPEPATLWLLGAALGAFSASRRSR
jgi:hypothetical protein